MASKARRVVRQLNAQQREDYRRLAAQIDREEKEEIVAKACRFKSEHDELVASLEHLMTALKQERERQGLSLTDMNERTGIDRAALSRLESGRHPNPTVATLMRYARALGKELDVVIREPVAR